MEENLSFNNNYVISMKNISYKPSKSYVQVRGRNDI